MKKSRITLILLILVFLAGLSLLLYPFLSNYWNSYHATSAIASYGTAVSDMHEDDSLKMYQEAIAYNKELAARGNAFKLTKEELERYEDILDVTGTGIMGYVEIPTIGVSLPIYHGTDEGTLQIAVGHLDWSSLPVGGESSHCVLCGHRGLPSSKLFTDLDVLGEGDAFTITVLDNVLTYEIDQIRIVEPDDVKDLTVIEGKDLCTLQTCTPYGINSHRLLVRGHRIESAATTNTARLTSEGIEIEPMIVAPVMAAPLLLILLLLVIFEPKRKAKKRNNLEGL